MCPHTLYKTNKILHAFSCKYSKNLKKANCSIFVASSGVGFSVIFIKILIITKNWIAIPVGKSRGQENETKGKDHSCMVRIGLSEGTFAQACGQKRAWAWALLRRPAVRSGLERGHFCAGLRSEAGLSVGTVRRQGVVRFWQEIIVFRNLCLNSCRDLYYFMFQNWFVSLFC